MTDPPNGTGPGVYTVTDPFGTGTVPKTGPAFLEVQFSEQVPCEQKAYPARFLDRNHLEPVPCEHSLRRIWVLVKRSTNQTIVSLASLSIESHS